MKWLLAVGIVACAAAAMVWLAWMFVNYTGATIVMCCLVFFVGAVKLVREMIE